MIKGLELCPHCGTKQNEKQPQSHTQTQVIEYGCGNTITYTFGEHGSEDSHISHEECDNKIDWTNILVPHAEEFDAKAKEVDERFFGWIEYQFYSTYHQQDDGAWYETHPNNSCTSTKYLDQYFNNKELYLKSVRELSDAPAFVEPQEIIIIKEYTDPLWLGEVSMNQVGESIDGNTTTTVYKIIAAEEYEYIGDYVIEKITPGEDKSVYRYDRKVLDLIVKGL